jgi:hypothetical protein
VKSKTTRFLIKQICGPDFWLMVLAGVLIYYLITWRMRLKNNVFQAAGEFAKTAL